MEGNENPIGVVLEKEIYRNPAITSVVNSTISEWDIKGAHLVAIKILYGDGKIYNTLASMDKLQRNIQIGKMCLKDPSLVKKLQELLYKFKKQFILENNIQIQNILETTKDSVMLAQKIPNKTTIKVDGVDVLFVNKEGFYSSYYRVFESKTQTLLFDSLTGNLRIKGIDMKTVSESPFVNEYLKPLLYELESSVSLGPYSCMKMMKTERNKYIDPDDIEIYRCLNNKNKFLYDIGDEAPLESDVELKDGNLIKVVNYKDFVMPLMKTVI